MKGLNAIALLGVTALTLGVMAPQAANADYCWKTTSYTRTTREALPASEVRTTIERTLENPVVIERVVDRPVVMDRVIERPVAVERVIDRPVVVERYIDRPVTIERVVDRPVVINRVIERPVTIRDRAHLMNLSLFDLFSLGLL